MILCKTPKTAEQFQRYYQLRWQILREPWLQPLGSEQDALEQQASHRMLVDEHEHVLAVGRLHKVDQVIAQIRYMAVANEQQGQGLGRQLLLALEQVALEQGAQQISLNAREQALAFYQKFGYQNHGFDHLLFEQINHFAMTKTLTVPNEHQALVSEQLTQLWHNTIAMSKAMNLRIGYFNGLQLVTTCDLVFNRNLHQTMFAGSIYTHATLTGWGWVYLLLQQQQLSGDIVLANANIRYLAPIKGAAHAVVHQNNVHGSCDNLYKRRRAKFNITCQLYCGDLLSAEFSGEYAVLPTEQPR